jgi:hypothetical protein
MRSTAIDKAQKNRGYKPTTPHNPALRIISIGLNRFAVVTRGKFWCHHLFFPQS